VSAERYSSLIGPVLTALDAIIAAAQCRGYDARAAGEFVEFKLYATLHVGDQIRDQLQTATSVAAPGVDGVIEVSLDRAARFALYVLVDSFLFESVSIRDALLQFVNMVFGLGIADDDRDILNKLKQCLPVTRDSNTGLEEWVDQSGCPSWFTRLIGLRNITTHRHPLRLPEQYQWRDDGKSPPSWRGLVAIESAAGNYEPLESFIESTEQAVADLLRVSLGRLGAFLVK
jgi:hypothetical protein